MKNIPEFTNFYVCFSRPKRMPADTMTVSAGWRQPFAKVVCLGILINSNLFHPNTEVSFVHSVNF